MKRHKELGVPTGELSLRDLEMILPSLIPRGNTAMLTDFDETVCSSYTYDAATKTHWPNIEKGILQEARRIKSLLFIATSRASCEPVVQTACTSLVAGKDLPIICENGAVLFFPDQNKELVLATEEQIQQMSEIKRNIQNIHLDSVLKGRELIIKNNRIATVELRIQHSSGVGDPTLYEELSKTISERFDVADLDLVSSNNSMSIQPKGVNKGAAFLQALSILGLSRHDLFVVGLGDAPNDREIFQQADLGIAVRQGAKPFANIFVNAGDKATLLVIKNLE